MLPNGLCQAFRYSYLLGGAQATFVGRAPHEINKTSSFELLRVIIRRGSIENVRHLIVSAHVAVVALHFYWRDAFDCVSIDFTTRERASRTVNAFLTNLLFVQVEYGYFHLHCFFGSLDLFLLLLDLLLFLLLDSGQLRISWRKRTLLLQLKIFLCLHAFHICSLLIDLCIYTLGKVFNLRSCRNAFSLLCSPLVSLSFKRFLEFKVFGARRFLRLLFARRGYLLTQVSEVGRDVRCGCATLSTGSRIQDHCLAILFL